jgi:hypothetical protein
MQPLGHGTILGSLHELKKSYAPPRFCIHGGSVRSPVLKFLVDPGNHTATKTGLYSGLPRIWAKDNIVLFLF